MGVVDGLDDGAAFFFDVGAVGVEAFVEVGTKFDEAGGEVGGGDVPGGEGTDVGGVDELATTGEG